mgnify:CR=1 FL=1
MSESQIVLENVTKRFGYVLAVEPVNLEIQKGEFIAIMGSSGCGKTTTLRMLAGLETPSEGEIRLNGRRINELKPHERETPLVWQSLALFPFLTVIENVEFGLKMRGVEKEERKTRAMKWLERMEIAHFADREISQLSGGQQQRVALARALVTEPPVLLLDEPLSALDANLIIRMQSVLTRLQKELGITFIYVTHSQSEAFSMADRVVIMSAGVVEQVGTPREIYRKPASRFVAEFVGSNNIVEGNIRTISDTVIEVDTGLGLIQAAATEDKLAKTGDSVDLIISADMVKISLEQTEATNEVEMTFIGEEFVGSIVTLYFEDPDGNEIKAQTQQSEILSLDLSVGDKAFIHWASENVYCLQAKDSHK